MHPVFLRIPLPAWSLPAAPLLLALALALVAAAELGRRARARELAACGAMFAALALLASVRMAGVRLTMGPLVLYAYGVLLSFALLASALLTYRLAVRDGIARNVTADAILIGIVAGIAGARLLYVATNLRDFRSLADVLAVNEGGLVFYGGVMGGALAVHAYLRVRRVAPATFADAVAPALALGSLIGRVGCYFAGCDYGAPLSKHAPGWLARLGTFPKWTDSALERVSGSPAWVDHVLSRGLSPEAPASLPVHPTQLYEAALSGGLAWFLLRRRERRKFHGELFLTYLLAYGCLRYLLEAFRDDPERGFFGPAMPLGAMFALAAVLSAIGISAGPLREAIRRRPWVAAVAVLPGLLAVAVRAAAPAGLARLSTSQGVALAMVVFVTLVWRRFTAPTVSS